MIEKVRTVPSEVWASLMNCRVGVRKGQIRKIDEIPEICGNFEKSRRNRRERGVLAFLERVGVSVVVCGVFGEPEGVWDGSAREK